MVNVASYFTDPDGDALTFTAASSNAATASVSVSGGVVTVTAVARGVATVTVTARDPGGMSAQSSFTVTVPNQAPVAVDAVPAQSIFVGDTASVDVSAYFNDPDGDALSYSVASSDATAVSASVAGSVVSLTAITQGMYTVTVTARDPEGLSAEQSVEVTVPNRAPTPLDTIPSRTLLAGNTLEFDLASYFTDPDGDALTFTAASSNAATASVSVSGSVVTVTAVARGVATVTVTARDPGGMSAQSSFTVTVPNQAPVAVDAVPAQSIFVGDTASVDVSAYFNDPDGDALSYSVANSDATAVSASVAGSVVSLTAITQGMSTVTVTARDPDGLSAEQNIEVTVPNRPPTTLDTIPPQTLSTGQSMELDMSSYFTDPDGDALTFAAASADTGVVSAETAGSTVTIAAIAPGTTRVTITATDPGGISIQQMFAVTVLNREPIAIGSIPGQSVEPGQAITLDVSPFFDDPDGGALSYSAVSSNTGVATATVAGSALTVEGVAAGAATITVTASDPGGLSAQLSFRATVQPEVVISGVEPAVLVEGASARITGSGFSATAAQNQVVVGGRRARVTSATATSLSIIVPRSDCLPPRREELRVAVGSKSDARTVGVTPQSLDVERNHYWYTYGGNGCLHLPGSASRGEYLIGVTSISEDPASLTGVTLRGTPWDASVAATESGRIVVAADGEALEEAGRRGIAALAQGPFSASAAFAGHPALPIAPASAGGGIGEWPLADDTLRMRRVRAHSEVMARSQALLRRLGRAARPALAAAQRELQVGDTLTLYADFPEAGVCTNSGQVRAQVRLVGNSSIWLDDLGNPAATFTDSELARLDAFYSANVKGVHDDYFGGLSDVDGNGRFLVLMTKEVNRESGWGGWVWAGDLYPSTQCATSNQAEIFYGRVPDPQGAVGVEVSKQDLLDRYPQLIAHEVTHLIQANAGLHLGAGGSKWKTSWEWEGGASLAEQLVAYRLFGHGSGRELGWSADTASREGGDWYWKAWMADMGAFFGRDGRGDGTGRIPRAPEECSWVGRPDEGNSGPCLLGSREVYGVPSMVLRYAMDRWGEDYVGGERALMRRLTVSPVVGLASLVDVSPEMSWRREYILADFYITLWLDLQPGYRAPGMSTWDLHDLFRRWPSNWQLRPYTSSSPTPRLTGRRVRAGSSLYFHWTPAGALRPTSIKVTSPGVGRVPDHISVWALRVR